MKPSLSALRAGLAPKPAMNTTKHTPGPWAHTPFNLIYLSVHADSGNPHQTRGRICQVDAIHGPSVLGPGREREECEANARLIAAAPQLLAILQKIVAADDAAMAEMKAMGIPVGKETRILTEEARAAIAAATKLP